MSNDDVDILARTIYGEARGEGQEGMEAVASVILNRVKARRWAKDIRGVILQPKQFSAWNNGDPNRRRMEAVRAENDRHFRMALDIAQRAVDGKLVDNTRGADHYHEQSIMPRWARGANRTVRIGRHIFYRLG